MRLLGRIVMVLVLLLLVGGGGFAWWAYTPDLPRETVAARFVAPGDRFVDVEGVNFHVREEGPEGAPLLVLIHGNASMLQSWDGWAGDLAKDYRVIRFDLAGHGMTGPDPAGTYSPERDVVLLSGLLDKLGVAKAVLIGNSLGGQIAWNFAVGNPDRVEKLVLVSPGGYPRPGFDYDQKPVLSNTTKALPFTLKRPAVKQVIGSLYGDPARFSETMLDNYYLSWLAPGVRKAQVARLSNYVLQPPDDRLRSIQAPVLLIWGEKDWLVPFASDPARFLAALPHARLVSFPGLGHMAQEEDPAGTLPAVRAFLAE